LKSVHACGGGEVPQAVHAGPADPTRRLSSADISCPKPAKTAATVSSMTDRSPFAMVLMVAGTRKNA
jgi:hypothetical protein